MTRRSWGPMPGPSSASRTTTELARGDVEFREDPFAPEFADGRRERQQVGPERGTGEYHARDDVPRCGEVDTVRDGPEQGQDAPDHRYRDGTPHSTIGINRDIQGRALPTIGIVMAHSRAVLWTRNTRRCRNSTRTSRSLPTTTSRYEWAWWARNASPNSMT